MDGTVSELPSPEDDVDRKILADVEHHGWHVITVPGGASTPGWAYSIGLHHTFEHPEVILFGLPVDPMHRMINVIGDAIRDGTRFSTRSTSTEILEGYTCAFESVAPPWYEVFLGYAVWFHQGADFPVVQCLWPDRDGALPTDERFDPDLLDLQPLLWHTSAQAARAEAILHSIDL